MTETTAADTKVQIAESPQLSRAVVKAVAAAEGVDETELDPLFDVIDPDHLNALFQPQLQGLGAPDVDAEIRFTYHGYEVRATAPGQVELTEL